MENKFNITNYNIPKVKGKFQTERKKKLFTMTSKTDDFKANFCSWNQIKNWDKCENKINAKNKDVKRI